MSSSTLSVPKVSKAILAALALASLTTPEEIAAAADDQLVAILSGIENCDVEKTMAAIRKAAPFAAPDQDDPEEMAAEEAGAETQDPVIGDEAPEPCPYCTAGKYETKHGDGTTSVGNCPHCGGTGEKDEDEPATPEEPIVPGSLAGRTVDELNLHELRGVAKTLGIPHIASASIKQMRDELEAFQLAHGPDGHALINRAVTVSEPIEPDGLWQFAETVPGVMDAVDPAGWFTASVKDDGSAVVTLLAPPDLHNRSGGASSDDITITVPNLKGFIDRLTALNKAANVTFAKK